MDAFGIFGLMGFVMACITLERVGRLERLLRENGIRPAGTPGLARRLEDSVGKTVTIFDEDRSGVTGRVLDVDEDWVLVLADEGKKKERERLLRLDSVTNIKVK